MSEHSPRDSGKRKPWRVAILNSHPIQYFAPLYAAINRSNDIELTALYYSDKSLRNEVDAGFGRKIEWNIDLLAGYPHKFVGKNARTALPAGFFSLSNQEIWKEIREGGYDAVILHGHMYLADLIAFLAAKSIGLRTYMHCETHALLARSSFRRWVRDFVLRFFYGACTGCLAIGSANRAFYGSLGIPAKRIFSFPYSVDNERFTLGADSARDRRDALRDGLGLTKGVPTVLFSSKLQRRKFPGDVIRAAALLGQEGLSVEVLMVGTGEMAEELEELAARSKVRVVFAGFINQAELPSVMSAADVFVLPSINEPWGLVVNEAMCASLPIVVGREVGCAADLIREGENGYTCTPGRAETLAKAIKQILWPPGRAEAMGRASRDTISSWSYTACLEGLRAALAASKQARSTLKIPS